MQSNLSDNANAHLSNFQSINSVTESFIFIDKNNHLTSLSNGANSNSDEFKSYSLFYNFSVHSIV